MDTNTITAPGLETFIRGFLDAMQDGALPFPGEPVVPLPIYSPYGIEILKGPEDLRRRQDSIAKAYEDAGIDQLEWQFVSVTQARGNRAICVLALSFSQEGALRGDSAEVCLFLRHDTAHGWRLEMMDVRDCPIWDIALRKTSGLLH